MARKQAMMQLMDAILAVHGKIENVAEWCRINEVNVRTFYRHRARIQAEGSWSPRSRRPHTTPHATPQPVIDHILRLRAHLAPDNGADHIRDALTELAATPDWTPPGWPVPSRATINRILDRHDLLARNPKKRPRASFRRFTYARPRDCYQIDATELALADGAKVVVVEVIDDATRTLVAQTAAHTETSTAVITAFQTACDRYGAPAIVLSDNGPAFTARHRHPAAGPTQFARTVTDHGSRLIHSSPYHPQTCGKVERHHQTFKRWLAHHPTPTDLAGLQALCGDYQDYYNTRRRHSSIGRITPSQAWDHATSLGGPQHLPVQTDATIHALTVTTQGQLHLGHRTRVRVGKAYARQPVTVIRDGDRATVYTTDGDPIGHLHIDPTKDYQGKIIPAA